MTKEEAVRVSIPLSSLHSLQLEVEQILITIRTPPVSIPLSSLHSLQPPPLENQFHSNPKRPFPLIPLGLGSLPAAEGLFKGGLSANPSVGIKIPATSANPPPFPPKRRLAATYTTPWPRPANPPKTSLRRGKGPISPFPGTPLPKEAG